MESDAEGGSAFALDLSEDATREPAPLTPGTSVGGTPALHVPTAAHRGLLAPLVVLVERVRFAVSLLCGRQHVRRWGQQPLRALALPAIRAQPAVGGALWANVKLYVD